MQNQKYEQNESFSKEEELELYEAMSNGCEYSRDEFILRNQGLIWYAVKKYYSNITLPSTVTQEDLIAEGQVGLITAVDKFDPAKGRFSTYAIHWIRATISQFLHSFRSPTGLGIHVSVALNQIDVIAHQLAQELQRPVTNQDLIDHPEVKEICSKKVLPIIYRNNPELLLQLKKDHSGAIYLDQPIDSAGTQNPSYRDFTGTYKDLLEDTSMPVFTEQTEKKDLIEYLFTGLDDRERFIITSYFGLFDNKQLTLKQIAKQLGIREQRLQQLKESILNSLKMKAKEDPELIDLFAGDEEQERDEYPIKTSRSTWPVV